MTDNSCRPGNDLHESTRNNCHQPKRNYHQHWKGRIINEPQQLISKYILNHGLWLNSLTQTLFLDNFSRCDQPIWEPKILQHTMLNIVIHSQLDKNDRELAGGKTKSMNSAQIIGQFASISITLGNIDRFSKSYVILTSVSALLSTTVLPLGSGYPSRIMKSANGTGFKCS